MNNELYHYGVPGMKWGKRKASYTSNHRSTKKSKKTNVKRSVRRAQEKYNKKAQRQIDASMRNAKYIKTELKNDRQGYLSLDETNETRKSYQHEKSVSIENAKHWMDTQNKLMQKTTVADIKKEYKESIRKAKVYYPFG